MNIKLLREDLADRLLRADLTNPDKILQLTVNELQRLGNFSSDDAKSIFFVACESVKPEPDRSTEAPKCITVGCPIIDGILGGGLRMASGINELSGESGCGKTQFCLRLALTAQNPVLVGGVDKSVLYICTEDSFPSKRLLQLINNIRHPFKNARELSYGDRILVEHIADVKGLKECLISRLPTLLKSSPVGLLIIDSITAVFRAEYSFSDGVQRTKDLRCIGCQLHTLSRKYGICVLCVNQVTASMNNTHTCVPALGLAWANLVTTRIMMMKSSIRDTRKLELVFSPHHKPCSCDYTINEFGVEGIS